MCALRLAGPQTVTVWPFTGSLPTPALGPRSPPPEAFPDCLNSEVSTGCLIATSLLCGPGRVPGEAERGDTHRVVGSQPLDVIQRHINTHHAQDQLVLGAEAGVCHRLNPTGAPCPPHAQGFKRLSQAVP